MLLLLQIWLVLTLSAGTLLALVVAVQAAARSLSRPRALQDVALPS